MCSPTHAPLAPHSRPTHAPLAPHSRPTHAPLTAYPARPAFQNDSTSAVENLITNLSIAKVDLNSGCVGCRVLAFTTPDDSTDFICVVSGCVVSGRVVSGCGARSSWRICLGTVFAADPLEGYAVSSPVLITVYACIWRVNIHCLRYVPQQFACLTHNSARAATNPVLRPRISPTPPRAPLTLPTMLSYLIATCCQGNAACGLTRWQQDEDTNAYVCSASSLLFG